VGDDHPVTVLNRDNLAACLIRQNKHAEAEPFLRRALESRERALGESHPETLRSCGTLGSTLRALGREQEAEELQRRAQGTLPRPSSGQQGRAASAGGTSP
jgi:hypothetical protein